MKNIFSAYKFTSFKKLIVNRSLLVGSLMIFSTTILLFEFKELNQRTDNLSQYYEHVIKANQEYSQTEVEKIKSGSQLVTVVFWSSLILLFTVLPLIAKQLVDYTLNAFRTIEQQIRYLRNGNLSERITNIKYNDEFGKICWDLNEATDQFETLGKEFTTSIKYLSEKKYFRNVLTKGLKGSYSIMLNNTSKDINNYSKYLINEKEQIEGKASQLLSAMEKFSKGDLTEQLSVDCETDLMGRLFVGFNNSIKNINEMINQVNKAIDSTLIASTQIASAIEQMAAASKEQSQQTSDITMAVDEMIKTVVETTKNTTAAAESAKNAGNLAKEGSKVVQKSVTAINQIAQIVTQASTKVSDLGKDSDKIGEIVQVINEIADQTNLLALNAAIEAARAGEHGRGFAVVADEVRKLAERTTKSTEEIAGMIKQIQTATTTVVKSINEGKEEVESGIHLAESAGKAILDIVSTTNNVVDEINQVATASEEQSLTSEQIANNIENVNNAISESLIGIQQTASAAEALNDMTTNLQLLINKFKISNSNNQQIKVQKTKKMIKNVELIG